MSKIASQFPDSPTPFSLLSTALLCARLMIVPRPEDYGALQFGSPRLMTSLDPGPGTARAPLQSTPLCNWPRGCIRQ